MSFKVIEVKAHPNGNCIAGYPQVTADNLSLEAARELAAEANDAWVAKPSSHYYRIGDDTDPGKPLYEGEEDLRAGLAHRWL